MAFLRISRLLLFSESCKIVRAVGQKYNEIDEVICADIPEIKNISLQEDSMKPFTTVLTIVLLLAFASLAVAQPDPMTEKMITEVRQKLEGISSYKVDMKMEMPMMGQTTVSNGQMSFKKPNKMHMSTTSNMMGGMKQDIYVNEDIMWTYMPLMNMATKLDLSKIKGQEPKLGSGINESADITDPFKGLPKDSIKFLEKKTVDNKEVLAFEARMPMQGAMPTGQSPQQPLPEKIGILISADSGLPYQIFAYQENGTLMMKQTYSNFTTNIPIDDSEFVFTPPEGVQVMDMTQGAMNMMKQMEGSQPKPE